jgi:hypothetical protein
MKRAFALIAAFTSVSLLLAACEHDKGEEGDEENVAATCPSAPAAMTGTPSLPTGWPTVDATTYTSQKKAGPSTIVSGYFADDLDGAFPAYEDALKGASFTITRDEQDAADAEIDFSGGNSTGEVKMTWPCKGRTDLTITIRPA